MLYNLYPVFTCERLFRIHRRPNCDKGSLRKGRRLYRRASRIWGRRTTRLLFDSERTSGTRINTYPYVCMYFLTGELLNFKKPTFCEISLRRISPTLVIKALRDYIQDAWRVVSKCFNDFSRMNCGNFADRIWTAWLKNLWILFSETEKLFLPFLIDCFVYVCTLVFGKWLTITMHFFDTFSILERQPLI